MTSDLHLPDYFKIDNLRNRLSTSLIIRYKDIEVPAHYFVRGSRTLLSSIPAKCLRATFVRCYMFDSSGVSHRVADKYFYEIARVDGASIITAGGLWLHLRIYTQCLSISNKLRKKVNNA